jgi:hypothetical protein
VFLLSKLPKEEDEDWSFDFSNDDGGGDADNLD